MEKTRPTGPEGPARRAARPLAQHLSLLVWIAGGPLLLLAAVLAFLEVQRVRHDLETQAAERASTLAIAVDRALQSRLRGLEMIAATPFLDDPSRRADAYALAKSFLSAYEGHVILADRDQQMLFNTRLPLDAALPQLPQVQGRSAAAQVWETGRAAVGDSFMGPVARVRLVALAVPVRRQDATTYVLLSTLEAERFQPFLAALSLPAGWRAAIRDSQGRLVAGRGDGLSDDPLPAPDTHEVRQSLKQAPWTASIEIPAHALTSPIETAALLMGAAVALTALSGLIAASAWAGRLTEAVARLSDSTRSLPAGVRTDPALGLDTEVGAADAPAASSSGEASRPSADPPSTGVLEFDRVRQRLAASELQRDASAQALAESERKYRQLFDRNPHPMWVYDRLTFRFMAVNEAAIVHYGYTREEFLSMCIADIRPETERRRLEAATAAGHGGPERRYQPTGQWIHRTRDGRLIDVEVTVADITFDGHAARIALAHDITARLAAEVRLRESERDFRTLAEQLPAIVYRARLEPVGHTDYVSPRVAELGYTPEQWRADPQLLWQVMHPEDRERVRDEVQNAFARGDAVLHLEYRMRGLAGDWRHRADHCQLVMPADGRAPFVLGINMDMTDARRAEAELRTYQQELSQLTHRLLEQERETSHHVAQALHDQLGQSLAVARLHLDAAIVRHGQVIQPELRGELQRLSTQLDRAIGDVRHVLGDLRPPMLEEQGLVAALDNETRSRALDPKDVDVLLEIDDAMLTMRWPGDVEYAAFMIAREAIVNAQQHAGASLIRVIVAGHPGQLSLEVVDDGEGIPEDLRAGRPGHLGLVGMRERAAAIHGQLDIGTVPDGGTRVALEWQEAYTA